ncbi:MAG: hypothetical protein AB1454_14170 [Candidatus Auribacterota bacterium]|jgi:hypothetical protein|uniref:Uncharacterized protein n=1 Tax=Candidatus Auribacter fodinae TaxID=2093366 RepID=A0A3A4R673_9BACT|nr:MAG: hypothetical protein C4541_00910 [Candidatus Auribacter fodinae]
MTEKNSKENAQMVQSGGESVSPGDTAADKCPRAEINTDAGTASAPSGKTGFASACLSFVRKYDAEIRLSILILYVISLVIAAVIELLEH